MRSFRILQLFHFNGDAGLSAHMKESNQTLHLVLLLIICLNSTEPDEKTEQRPKNKQKKTKLQIAFSGTATGI